MDHGESFNIDERKYMLNSEGSISKAVKNARENVIMKVLMLLYIFMAF